MEAGGERQKCEERGEEGYREHMAKRRKTERERNRRERRRAAGEMIMIGTTNGEFIYTV